MADKGAESKRFQTRAGISRKSKAEREQYAQDEAARQQQRLAESSQTPRIGAPDKGRPSARGRLNALSNSTARVRNENTGGVFGAAAAPLAKPWTGRPTGADLVALEDFGQLAQQEAVGKGLNPISQTTAKATDEGDNATVKSEKRTTVRGRVNASKRQDAAYVSSEDDVDEDARRDIEQIWISSDEEIISTRVKGKQREKGPEGRGTALRPLRAPRDSRIEGEALSARNRMPSGAAKNVVGLAGEDAVLVPTTRDDNAIDVVDKMLPPTTGDMDRRTSKRKGNRSKDTIAVTETAEEHAERLRYNAEVRKLVDELDRHKSPSQAGAAWSPSSGAFQDRRLYLFQFPPLTPVLADPAEGMEVKQEPEVEIQPVPSALEKTNGATIKKEEGGEERKKKKSDVLTADNMQLPSGLVGTLRVHKSGKVTLDWGGADLEVRYGTEVDFLQDVVMTDETEQTAWALGQVERKMVCIPNWQKLYE